MSETPEVIQLTYAPVSPRRSERVDIAICCAALACCIYFWMPLLVVEVCTLAQAAPVVPHRYAQAAYEAIRQVLNNTFILHLTGCASLCFLALCCRGRSCARSLALVLGGVSAISFVILAGACLLFPAAFGYAPAFTVYTPTVWTHLALAGLTSLLVLPLPAKPLTALSILLLFSPLLLLVPVTTLKPYLYPEIIQQAAMRSPSAVAATCLLWWAIRITSRRYGIPVSSQTGLLVCALPAVTFSHFWFGWFLSQFECMVVYGVRVPAANLIHMPLLFADAAAIYCICRARRAAKVP